MKYPVNMESMPEIVVNTWGQAQKRLTIWEGEARKVITNSYTWIRQYPSFTKVETKVVGWQTNWQTNWQPKYTKIGHEWVAKLTDKVTWPKKTATK